MSIVEFEKVDLICEKTDSVFSIGKLVHFDKKLVLLKAMSQALLKSQHTNDGNQNNDKRTPSEKFNKQLQGIFAEIVVFEYINSIFCRSDIETLRYDDVRTDEFKSPVGEYDLKIKRGSNEREIEVRSSISYKKPMSYDTLKEFHVIGPYTNKAKKYEAMNDYYIRPIFQLKDTTKKVKLSELNIFELLLNNEIDFYITGGCTKKMMLNDCEIVQMGQKRTTYDAVRVLDSLDIPKITQLFRNLRDNKKTK
tara:strand:- start:76769 stop:77521 length:753 start_codon:yes stop_codon:yes gene_type:complete